MKTIVMLTTVEDQATGFVDQDDLTPVPLNDVAIRKGVEISRREGEEMVTVTWLMPEDGEFEVSDRQAKRLIDLEYAEEI